MQTSRFEYRRLGDFTYHVLVEPADIRAYLLKWIMREWEEDHREAPDEAWTVAWMTALPSMDFTLERVILGEIRLHPDLMEVPGFQRGLNERANEREQSFLRGTSVEPLLIDRSGFQLMDGYTRYTVLKRCGQSEVYAYLGSHHPYVVAGAG